MADAWGKISSMHVEKVGVFHQLSRRCSWLAVPFLCFLTVPAAQSQKSPQKEVPSSNSLLPDQTDEANARITELAIAATAKQSDYIIGAGDLLGIEVFDITELSRDVRVNESGLVSLPLIPVKIQAAGLTPFQLQDKIAELLQVNGLVSHPEVSVSVKERHGEPITMAGAVKMPMVIEAVGRMTLLEALSQAGGIAPEAGDTVTITRPARPANPNDDDPPAASIPPTSITVNLLQLLDSGDPKYNIPLLGGDVVNVSHAGIVYAVGAVQRAGGYVMSEDHQQMSVLKILALTGGLIPTAKSRDAVILRRDPSTGGRQQVPVDLRKILTLKASDVLLAQDDILFVPDSAASHALRRTGEVALGLASGAALYRVDTF